MFLLIPFYLIFVLIMIVYLMKRYTGQHKWRRIFLLAFLFYLPVGWDVILGRTYFYYLCNKDGGVHIYQTVELGPEYLNEDGSPKFYTKNRTLDNPDKIFYESGKKREYKFTRTGFVSINDTFNIRKLKSQVIDTTSGVIMGEWVVYETLGGWVMNTGNPFGKSGTQCYLFSDIPNNPKVIGIGDLTYQKFTSYIFLKKDVNQGEKQ